MYCEYVERLSECTYNTIFTGKGRPELSYEDGMKELVDIFQQIKRNQKQLFFIGNGGSAAIAGHMTADFMKNGRMKTYSLYDQAVSTCMSNDYGYESVFSKPLALLANKEDLLVAISSSGNSKNILNAINTAKEKNCYVITFTGFHQDNQARLLGDYNIYVPICEYGIVESVHNLILQQAVDTLSKC